MEELMKITASGDFDFNRYLEVPEGNIEAKLFQIIDDIDTATDMFKPKIEPFERYVLNRIKAAKELIISDGYKLYYRQYRSSNEAD